MFNFDFSLYFYESMKINGFPHIEIYYTFFRSMFNTKMRFFSFLMEKRIGTLCFRSRRNIASLQNNIITKLQLCITNDSC